MEKRNFILNIFHELYALLCLTAEGLEHVFHRFAFIIMHSAVIMKSGLLIAQGFHSLHRIHNQQKTNDQTSKIVKTLLLVLTISLSAASLVLITMATPVFSLGALMASSMMFLGYHGWRWRHTHQKLLQADLTDERKHHLEQKAQHRKHLFAHSSGHFLGFSLIFFSSCISPPLSVIISGVVLFLGLCSTVVHIHKLHQHRVSFLLRKDPNIDLISALEESKYHLPELTVDAQLSNALHAENITHQDTKALQKTLMILQKTFHPEDPKIAPLSPTIKSKILALKDTKEKRNEEEDHEGRDEHF